MIRCVLALVVTLALTRERERIPLRASCGRFCVELSMMRSKVEGRSRGWAQWRKRQREREVWSRCSFPKCADSGAVKLATFFHFNRSACPCAYGAKRHGWAPQAAPNPVFLPRCM